MIEEFLFIIMFLLGIIFLASFVGLIIADPRKQKDKLMGVLTDHKTSLFLIAFSFLLFLSYFAGTAQLLQLEQTITSGGVTFTVENNNYLFFYAFLPVVQGLFAMITMFCAGTIFRTFELFGRGRLE